MAVTRETSKDYIPDLRPLQRAESSSYAPLFRKETGGFSQLTPKSLMPSYAPKQSVRDTYTPSFSGLNFSPSSLARGTGMEGILGGSSLFYSPSFAQGSPLDLSPSSGLGTLDDIMRQYGIGQYKPVVPGQTGQPGGGFGVGAATGDAAILNQYNDYFAEAERLYGTPSNLTKAIAWTERGWEGVSPQGASGLMQIMPDIWGAKASELGYGDFATNPRSAILMGAWILSQNQKEQGSWEGAARAYLGFGEDAFGTDDSEYWSAVKDRWDLLNQSGGAVTGGGPIGGGSGLNSVFNGMNFDISQGIGPGNNAMDYSYGIGLGVGNNHPALDIAAPANTQAFFPSMGGMTGTVITSGGSGYFCDDYGCGPGQGELKIQLSNGDQIIFAHMRQINVQVGQPITPGMMLGLTGSAGSGEHLHLEYRKKSDQCSSGFCAIDPRNVIGY